MDSWQQGRHRAGWQIPITEQLLVLIIVLIFSSYLSASQLMQVYAK